MLMSHLFHWQEQAKIAKLGLEMKLITSEMEAEADKWAEPDNAVVRRAKNMAAMAFSMYLFTRGEGRLHTTHDLFLQAEFFAEEGNKLYRTVKDFASRVSWVWLYSIFVLVVVLCVCVCLRACAHVGKCACVCVFSCMCMHECAHTCWCACMYAFSVYWPNQDFFLFKLYAYDSEICHSLPYLIIYAATLKQISAIKKRKEDFNNTRLLGRSVTQFFPVCCRFHRAHPRMNCWRTLTEFLLAATSCMLPWRLQPLAKVLHLIRWAGTYSHLMRMQSYQRLPLPSLEKVRI